MLCTVRIRPIPLVLALVAATVTVLPGRGADAAPRGSKGCGRPASPGVTTRHVTVDGTDREYLLAVPEGYSDAEPAPLLFDFHGLGSDMQEQAGYTQLAEQGGARRYVVITPNGQGDVLRRWSLVASANANPDVAFVQAMLRATGATLCIDPKRLFSTGISNGAMFSTVLACALPGRFAAIAPVSGINATKACDAGAPRVSVLAFHGTADPIVPYQGGDYFAGAAAGRTPGARRPCRSTMLRRRGLRSTGAERPRRPPGLPPTCSTWSGPTARPTAPSSCTASSAAATPGPVRSRCGRPASDPRPRRSVRPP